VPFLTETGEPLDRVPLLYRMGRDFQLTEGFSWLDPRDLTSTIPVAAHDTSQPPRPGNSTDFASVPPFLWGLIASYGKQTLPAILHDQLVYESLIAPPEQRLAMRRTADEIFRIALIDSGVHPLRARVMWAGVGVERYARHAGALGTLLIAQFVLGAVAVIAGVVLGVIASPLWFLLLSAPGIAAAAWWRNADLMIVLSYVGALYAPLVLSAFIASHLDQALAIVVWRAHGGHGDRPRAEPTLFWPTPAESPGR
jgi:hypothetical protein